MIFLLGVLVGGLLVCLPLVVIVLTARWQEDQLEAVALTELQMRSIKRETVRQMFGAVNGARERTGFESRPGGRFGSSDDVVDG